MRRGAVRGPASTARARLSSLALVLVTQAAVLLFGFGFLARFNALAANTPEVLAYGMPPGLNRLLWMPWLIAACAVMLSAATAASWLGRVATRLSDRLLMTVTCLCGVAFALLLVHFGMLPPAR